jgi:hypothetical protein
MAENAEVHVGDWVRYYRNGAFAIGEVRYISEDWRSKTELLTDNGACDLKSVLEVRAAPPSGGTEP